MRHAARRRYLFGRWGAQRVTFGFLSSIIGYPMVSVKACVMSHDAPSAPGMRRRVSEEGAGWYRLTCCDRREDGRVFLMATITLEDRVTALSRVSKVLAA